MCKWEEKRVGCVAADTYAVEPQAALTSTSWGSASSSRPREPEQEERGRDEDFSVRPTLRPCGQGSPGLIT